MIKFICTETTVKHKKIHVCIIVVNNNSEIIDARHLNLYMYNFFAGPVIEHFSQVFLVCGIHFAFFVLALMMTNKWKSLWCTLMTIQQEMELSELFYRKCRRRCFVALALLVLNAFLAFAVQWKLHKYKYIPQTSCLVQILHGLFTLR